LDARRRVGYDNLVDGVGAYLLRDNESGISQHRRLADG
jgi:hypothetical protein